MKNIIIVYGGKSTEHDISVITACLARGYFKGEIYSVYFDKNNESFLVPNDYAPVKHVTEKLKNKVVFLFGEKKIGVCKRNRIVKKIDADVVINCCHGNNGEDGTIAALCSLLGVPQVGSPLIPSAVAMDKVFTKRVLRDANVPVIEGFEVTPHSIENLRDLAKDYEFPLIVKPATLGSSIGVKVCSDFEELNEALALAFRYDDKVLCERALTDFIELNCAAMRVNGEIVTSVVDCPVSIHDILTFEDKYVSNQPIDLKKTEVPKSVSGKVTELTSEIYGGLGFSGVIRVDYLYDKKTDKLFVNEINTIPGSLAYGLWEGRFSRAEYGQALIEQAIADNIALEKRLFVFDSGVLKGINGIKKK